MTIEWQFSRFPELVLEQLYSIMAERSAVFVVEQGSLYQDLDGLDLDSHHLTGWSKDKQVVAYARIIPPGKKYDEPSIGRVLVAKSFRGQGYGRELIKRALSCIERAYPGSATRLSAQAYLEHLYQAFGFQTVSEPYEEDGIPHVEMLRPAK